MICRVSSYVLLVAGLIGLAVSAYGFFFLQDAPRVSIDEPERELGELSVGSHEVQFRLHNPTPHTVRIVGAESC